MGANKKRYKHYTPLHLTYCSVTTMPYFEWLLVDRLETDVQRSRILNNSTMICGVKFYQEPGETLTSVFLGKQQNINLIKMVFRVADAYLHNDKRGSNGNTRIDDNNTTDSKVYILMHNLFVDCIYSARQCIVVPQPMYCLYKDGEEPMLDEIFTYSTFPESEDASVCQDIYKSFIVYNTVLTMMLAIPNPFNDKNKVISKIIESVGVCDGGIPNGPKNRLKVCELPFAVDTREYVVQSEGQAKSLGHVMCPPREMVTSIYRYAKWELNPKNYHRYVSMIVGNNEAKSRQSIREWHYFIMNFKTFFFPT